MFQCRVIRYLGILICLLSLVACGSRALYSPGYFDADPWTDLKMVQWQSFNTTYKGKNLTFELPVQEGVKLSETYCCGIAFSQGYDSYELVEASYWETGGLFSVQASSFVSEEHYPFGIDTSPKTLIAAERARIDAMFLGQTGENADRYRNLNYSIYISQDGTEWVQHSLTNHNKITRGFQRVIATSEVLTVFCHLDERYSKGTEFGGHPHPEWFDRRIRICEKIVDSVFVM